MATNDFTQLTEKLKEYGSDLFLGRLCWYSISEESRVDHAQFCALLINNGLADLLPSAPRPSDVFKRACTASQTRKVPTADPKIFVNYMIREVGKDTGNIWRRLVAETVDTDGRKLGYAELAELHFERATQTIHTKPMHNNVLDGNAKNILSNVLALFQQWNNLLTPMAVRELTRKILVGLNATVVRPSGGVYFVRESHAAVIDALEAVIPQLPGECSFHSFPLVDDTKQREMLRQAFEDESVGEIDRMLGEIRSIMKADSKITTDRFAEYKTEYDRLRKKIADYSDLLDTAMVNTATRLEIMDQLLFDLLGRVK